MYVSGLLISWPTPEASRPMDAMRSALMRRSSMSVFSVTSWQIATKATLPSNIIGSAVTSMRRGAASRRRRRCLSERVEGRSCAAMRPESHSRSSGCTSSMIDVPTRSSEGSRPIICKNRGFM